jgi:hypothetical protein
VEGQLGHEIVDVLRNKRRISAHAIAARCAPGQALEPAGVGLRFLEHDGMAFLQDFVDCNERLERLNFVGQDWLPVFRLAFVRSSMSSVWV